MRKNNWVVAGVVLFLIFTAQVFAHQHVTILRNDGVVTDRIPEHVVPGQGDIFRLAEKCDLLPRLIQPGESSSSSDLPFFPEEGGSSEFPDPDRRWSEREGEVLVPQPEEARIEGISEVLVRCPRIRKQLVWVNGKGERKNYDKWTDEQVERFDDLYAQLYVGEEKLDAACIDAKNAVSSASGSKGYTFYTEQQAFDIYAAHAAHVLYTEAMGLVSRSIFNHPDSELAEMLHSDRYFRHIEITQGYQSNSQGYYPSNIKPERDFIKLYEQGDADYFVICDPRDGYRYLRDHNLIGQTQEQTLTNISLFFKENVFHADRKYGSHLRQKNNKTLATRLLRDPSGGIPVAGCHGAADTFRDLARSINIPLIRLRTPEVMAHKQIQQNPFPLVSLSHGSLCWRWTGSQARCITHLDDIYAISLLRDPYFPVDSSGQKLSAEQEKATLFTSNWLNRNDMKKRGFDFQIETVTKGSKWGKYTQGSEMFPDFGKIQGSWAHSDSAVQYDRTSVRNSSNRFPSNPHGADIQQKHQASLYYDLGIYNSGFLQKFCKCHKFQVNERAQCLKTNQDLKKWWLDGYKKQFEQCKKSANTLASFGGGFDQALYDRELTKCENTYKSNVAGAEKDIKDVRDPKCEVAFETSCAGDKALKNINDVLLTKKTGMNFSYLPSIDDYRTKALKIIDTYGSCDALEKTANDENKQLADARKSQYRKERQP